MIVQFCMSQKGPLCAWRLFDSHCVDGMKRAPFFWDGALFRLQKNRVVARPVCLVSTLRARFLVTKFALAMSNPRRSDY